MNSVKLVVQYPHPHDVYMFDKIYAEDHIPLEMEKLDGKIKIIETTPLPDAHHVQPTYHHIAEIYFPSMEALQACTESDRGKEVMAHAVEISTGGAPDVLIEEEEILEA